MDIKNDSRTNGLSLSTIDCQACVLRPSCESTIYINQGDVVLSPDMDACKTTPEPYIATIKLAPPLNQVFQNPIRPTQFSKLLNRCGTEINSRERTVGTDQNSRRKTNGPRNFTKTD